MKKLWITIKAKLREPITNEELDETMTHYYCVFGATYASYKDALPVLTAIITQDNAFIEDVEVEENVIFEELDPDVREQAENPDEEGIWYQSGRILFDEDDEPGEPDEDDLEENEEDDLEGFEEEDFDEDEEGFGEFQEDDEDLDDEDKY